MDELILEQKNGQDHDRSSCKIESVYHLKVYSSIFEVILRTLINTNKKPSKERSVGK
jgi:hypothetical protein